MEQLPFCVSDRPNLPRNAFCVNHLTIFSIFLTRSTAIPTAPSDSGEAWILVESADPIDISEIQIQLSSGSFPQSFDFVMTGSDGKIKWKGIRNADLSGLFKSARYEIVQSLVLSVKIEQKWPNYQSSQYLNFKALEFFSNTWKYESGLFHSRSVEHRDEIRKFVCVDV
jgi:hypothetical protein